MIYLFQSDIDKCAERTHQCSQVCHDTPGSYSCSCRPGYDLNSDRRHCDGRPGDLLEALLQLVRPWQYHHSEFLFLFYFVCVYAIKIITMTYKLVHGIA